LLPTARRLGERNLTVISGYAEGIERAGRDPPCEPRLGLQGVHVESPLTARFSFMRLQIVR